MFPYYTPRKHEKTKGSVVFSWGIKWVKFVAKPEWKPETYFKTSQASTMEFFAKIVYGF